MNDMYWKRITTALESIALSLKSIDQRQRDLEVTAIDAPPPTCLHRAVQPFEATQECPVCHKRVSDLPSNSV